MMPRRPTVSQLSASIALVGVIAAIGIYYDSVISTVLDENRKATPPKVDLVQTTIDFGDVTPAVVLRSHVMVHNAGSQRLIVHRQQSTCPCCEDEASAAVVIEPNKRSPIPIWLTAPIHLGPMAQAVSFETNDPNQPQFSVTVRAVVKLVGTDP